MKVLPSDCRFREDLIELIKGNEDAAQKWKEVLEEIQRFDRKLRLKASDKKGKWLFDLNNNIQKWLVSLDLPTLKFKLRKRVSCLSS